MIQKKLKTASMKRKKAAPAKAKAKPSIKSQPVPAGTVLPTRTISQGGD